jgi:hypothetical protein
VVDGPGDEEVLGEIKDRQGHEHNQKVQSGGRGSDPEPGARERAEFFSIRGGCRDLIDDGGRSGYWGAAHRG